MSYKHWDTFFKNSRRKTLFFTGIGLVFVVLLVYILLSGSWNFNINEYARGDECGYAGAPKCPTGTKCVRGFCESKSDISDGDNGNVAKKKCQTNQDCRVARYPSGENYCMNGKCVYVSGNNSFAVCGYENDPNCPEGTRCQLSRGKDRAFGRHRCYER